MKKFKVVDLSDIGMINKHRIVLDLIKKYSRPNHRILDIGCSDGKILKELERNDYNHLYGIDIQAAAKKAFQGTKIKYRDCDFENEPIPFKGKFDVIIMSDVLEHLFAPHTILFDLKKYLSDNGKIIFSMPNAGWFLNGILLTFSPNKLFVSTAFGPWGHTHQFTFWEVRRIARILKYKILSLGGGRLDNYAFKTGLKKLLFDIFVISTSYLSRKYPTVFSAHIFGVFENTKNKPKLTDRFDAGN